MDIFGLTPIDTALSVLGLNAAQIIANYLVTTPLSATALAAGFLFSIVKTARYGHTQPLVILFVVTLSALFLVLPQRPEGNIQSAQERYGHSDHSSQMIKDRLIEYHQIPVLLGFAEQISVAILAGAIHTFDVLMPSWAHFLTSPFGAARIALNMRKAIALGITDAPLHARLQKFLNDFYLPALGIIKNESSAAPLAELWPGHERVLSYYSSPGKAQWKQLGEEIARYFDQDPHLDHDARAHISAMTQSPQDAVLLSMTKSLVEQVLARLADVKANDWMWQATAAVVSVFPYMYGWANGLVLGCFPLMILTCVVTRSPRTIVHYCRTFAGVKAMALGAALCFYASLIVAAVAANTQSDPSWAWERPYFCAVLAILLVALPVGAFVIIPKHGGSI